MEDYPNLTKTMAETISELREDTGLSSAKLAELCGMDKVYLAQVQQGKHYLSLNAVFWLAKGLGMKAAKLVDLIERRAKSNS